MIQDELAILPEGIKLNNLLELLRKLSWDAADILVNYSKEIKASNNNLLSLKVVDSVDGPVSSADLDVNQLLIEGLEKNIINPPWKLLSEETVKSQIDLKPFQSQEWIWILDPLDGTKDFLSGTGDYAVHLALVKGHSPVLGVVLIPDLEELWFGVIGMGTWCEKRNRQKVEFSFSKRRDLNQLILVSSRNHRDKRLENLIEKISYGSKFSKGSVGCKVATILRGETDFYISLSGKTAPKDWDMAAPEALLKAAGGSFTHINESSLKYNVGDMSQRGCLVASHGFTHFELCNMIRDALQSIDSNF